MEDDTSFKDFQEWIKQTNKAIDVWTLWLAQKAKKEGKTYSSAVYWLDKNTPDMPHSYNATPVETFVGGVVPGMFQNAKIEIKHEALKQPIERKGK